MQIGKAARSNGSHIKSRLKMESHGVFKVGKRERKHVLIMFGCERRAKCPDRKSVV